ncbi:hypothetical protein DESUT3_35150 [Desulfuromonas versatilis]|uniref:Diguanylate cyclase/phosphodiesterase with PAS/PAC sensor(S) n=1 Tax=Desulfuromonas versatilis TaxID=2802975 RepID=A0ABM8HZB7_9BACT|nr:EAL domain-containing protein [Desulfuromonas versatilis]BCR06446.1 hypothetical protein DESUT3_35150 [Desulfuromonas versatilis]
MEDRAAQPITVILDLISQFTGGRGGIDHNIVQFGLAGIMWGLLLTVAWSRRRQAEGARERLLIWGFALGLARELMMISMAFLQALGIIHHDDLHVVFPPLEHALSNMAFMVVAAAFLSFLLGRQERFRRFLLGSLAAVAICYLATFWWWAGHITADPSSKFGQTWCDWLFRINASLWLIYPPLVLMRETSGWLRNLVVTALSFFFLHEFLKIPDMALGEVYEGVFAPIRHGLYLSGVFLLGGVYLREMNELRRRAELELRTQKNLLQTIIDAIPAPIFFKDRQGVYLGCNDAFARHIGYSREKIVGHTAFDVAPAEKARVYHEADLALLREGAVQVYETAVEAADGRQSTVLFHKSVFADPDGQPGGIVGTMIDISDRKRAELDMRRMAFSDAITGLANRALLLDRLEHDLATARRESHQVGLLFMDIDRFKDINDTYGHAVGDQLLQMVAERLKPTIRQSDTLGRFGGDEFILVLSCIKSQREAVMVAEKILELMKTPFHLQDRQVVVGFSIGIAMFPEDGGQPETLLKHADMAMYAAKQGGRNMHHFFSEEMNRRARKRHELEVSLRQAMATEELFLVYQPQYDLGSGRMSGVEALLRWRHPAKGLIPPSLFIPLAEDTGLIQTLGRWVLRSACAQAALWQQAGYPALRMCVNLSGVQLRQGDLLEMVDQALEETGLRPKDLELELTESVLMESAEANIGTLTELKRRGIHLAIDDFGTGYSSLSYLKHFPVDRIKIDRSFISDLPDNQDDAAIVETIIGMARSLKLKLVAEGVETKEQLEFLRLHNCLEMQGFYFAAPMPAAEIEKLLARGARCAVRTLSTG